MAKRKGLPKKYAKMGFKRGWAAYKRSKSSTTRRTYTKPVRRRRSRPMARKRSYRRSKSKLITKPFIDGLIASGGKIALRKFGVEHQLLDAGIDGAVGFIRKNKTLQAQAIVGGISTLLPNIMDIGATGSTGWEE